MNIATPATLGEWNAAGADYLPGLLGICFIKVELDEVVATLEVRRALGAWNGYLHAGTVTSLADTCCGYGTVRNLPAGASGFTTMELKNNLLGTAREGTVTCTARPVHRGRTTQVWDAEVRRDSDNALIATFRNTQLILWPQG
ncbi:PaaI family thioesterase [Lampropedia aestuarii]|uniref:PaaI family thioesterase n=1 Tax=Lampropedia aestuarii TaxID=2562762 RepID=A0A4S5BHM4_9BURK|nr:PaaI family thioesterase [Lampropedia aestuarii]THJ31589.1 PaaI family thioesterase [Lampropedia aestuarii]